MLSYGSLDSLHGPLVFEAELQPLIGAPILQRLRHVRLSNIDSIAFPGIANLSRFEHVLGVGHLAGKLPFFHSLPMYDRFVIQASALLHDWAITAFGHLVEEALTYAGGKFNHEGKLREILTGESSEDVGGVERQIFRGRETGLRKWANACVGPHKSAQLLQETMNTISGEGRFGPLISGDIDIDNIDNVYRVAFHMGLPINRSAPVDLVRCISGIDSQTGVPVFALGSGERINHWLITREKVYEHLMMAQPDFTAKLMLISAVVAAYEAGELGNSDWNLTDFELIGRLLKSEIRDCCETVDRWLVGEYWDASPLMWLEGERPAFDQLRSFNAEISQSIGRKCFSYCIKDKRMRKLTINFNDGTSSPMGAKSSQWLLGIGSPLRKAFAVTEIARVKDLAEQFFCTRFKGYVESSVATNENGGDQLCLL